MSKSRRIISGAAVAAWFGALGASGALAQDNSTIGPPQLKDFQLQAPPRPAPPRPAGPIDDSPNSNEAAARPRPAPVVSAPAPSLVATPAPAASAAPTQASRGGNAADRAPARQSAPPSETAPSGPPPAPELPPPSAAFPPSSQSGATAPSGQPGSAPAIEESTGWSPLWLLLPLLLAAAAGFVFWRRRRPEEDYYSETEAVPDPTPVDPVGIAPAVAPLAVAPPPLPPRLNGNAIAAVPAEDRAWLEVEFKPSRAAATDKEAIVHYELVLRNVGKASASNIRIDTRLFNAGAEADIKAFLAGTIHEQSGSPHVVIPPGEELRLGSTIAIAKEDVREIVVEGRSLFVPAVAINVAYNWAPAGTGRTSKSWLIGREAEQPSQKMGAFRLDLGPRIYRSVGQRQTGLAQMV